MTLDNLITTLLSFDKNNDLDIVLLSINELKEDIMVKAKFYEGDLLMTVLALEQSFWKNNPELWTQLTKIIDFQEHKIKDQNVSFEMKVDWYEKIEKYKNISF